MKTRILTSLIAACCLSSTVFARPQPVGPNEPVVIGQWHSNLTAAKAKAQELGVPLLVIFSLEGCSICASFDTALDSQASLDYFASRGLIMVYQKASRATEVSDWAGPGETKVPMVRITWWAGSVDYHWVRPGSFDTFKSTLESKIGGYVYNPTPPDTSKDAYDPASDSVDTVPTLTWSDQGKTENLKLAKKTADPAYTDLNDWYKLAVVTGATYTVGFSAVRGITTDAPKAAIYADAAGTQVLGAETALANGAGFEFSPVSDGFAYIKVWRSASADTNILYTMAYQRFAPGTIQFAQPSVSTPESSKSVALTVKRVGGTTGSVSAQVGYEDSATPASGYTATAGQDFNGTPSPVTLTWADGDAADKTVIFTLIKTVNEWEGAETFGATLTPVGDAAVGGDAVVTLTEVDALTTAAASYNGWVSETIGTVDAKTKTSTRAIGSLNLKVSSAGVISGKAVFPRSGGLYAGSYTVKNASHQSIAGGVAVIAGQLAQMSTLVPFTLSVDMASGKTLGVMGAGAGERALELYRDDWATAQGVQLAARLSGYYTVAFPVLGSEWPAQGAPTGSGYATLTVDTKGRFRAAGKLGDGTSFSQSGVLFVQMPDVTKYTTTNVCALLFTMPMGYQGGAFSGASVISDSDGDGKLDVTPSLDVPLVWQNNAPTSVETYNAAQPGFRVFTDAAGGWYNKTENLQTFYTGKRLYVGDLEEPLGVKYTLSTRSAGGVTTRTTEVAPSVSWEAALNLAVTPKADGSGLTVAAGDLAKLGQNADGSPVYNYNTAVNPNSLRLTFNRTTGLMTGNFNAYYDYATALDTTVTPAVPSAWRHTVKILPYAGVLLQEQNDAGNGVTGYGYFQSSGTSSYDSGSGYLRSYSFKQSSEFRIHSVPAVIE